MGGFPHRPFPMGCGRTPQDGEEPPRWWLRALPGRGKKPKDQTRCHAEQRQGHKLWLREWVPRDPWFCGRSARPYSFLRQLVKNIFLVLKWFLTFGPGLHQRSRLPSHGACLREWISRAGVSSFSERSSHSGNSALRLGWKCQREPQASLELHLIGSESRTALTALEASPIF